MTDAVRERLHLLSCTDLSDAMDRLGIACQCAGVMPLDRSFSLVGRAWTLRYGSIGQGGGSVGDYIDDIEPGQVVVLDNQARLDATVWGDLLTSTAVSRSPACRRMSRCSASPIGGRSSTVTPSARHSIVMSALAWTGPKLLEMPTSSMASGGPPPPATT